MLETKICPFCGEEIKAIAKKCKYCGEWLNNDSIPNLKEETNPQENNNTQSALENATEAMKPDDLQEFINLTIYLIVILIIGNYIFGARMIFHSYGHFGIIEYPWKCLKELFWLYDLNGSHFIYSFSGLKCFFIHLGGLYEMHGLLYTTWCIMTQFSPIFGIPIFTIFKIIYKIRMKILEEDYKKSKKLLNAK